MPARAAQAQVGRRAELEQELWWAAIAQEQREPARAMVKGWSARRQLVLQRRLRERQEQAPELLRMEAARVPEQALPLESVRPQQATAGQRRS